MEKECLGVVASLKHFDVFLIGRHFEIVTDHRALQYLQSMKNANPRLTRWALAVQPFDFSISHRPGKSHGNADGLSRQAWPEDYATDAVVETPADITTPRSAAEEEGRDVGNPHNEQT